MCSPTIEMTNNQVVSLFTLLHYTFFTYQTRYVSATYLECFLTGNTPILILTSTQYTSPY